MLHCAMRSSELIFSSGGYWVYRCLCFCRTIGGFPHCPSAVGDVKILPILVGTGGFLRAEHGFCRNDKKRCVCDGVVGVFGFGLASLRLFIYSGMPSLFRWYCCISFWVVRTYRAWSPPHITWRWASSFPMVTRV